MTDKLHSSGPKVPWRRKSGINKHGDDHPRYAEAVRFLWKYTGSNRFVQSLAEWNKRAELTYKQVEAVIHIIDQ